MNKDPNRYWWLSLVLVAACTTGFWYFEHALFPARSGAIGGIVGFLLGGALAAVLEDYFDQNLR
ncbi:MAG: hypothetical protein JOY81_10780 [Alphaproteobacteria bacterium]|nr:hypothetical protein [Alphaproteobacteria bacterium]